jgi:hypothetical protein
MKEGRWARHTKNVVAGGECAGEFLFLRGTNHTRVFVSVPLSSEMLG